MHSKSVDGVTQFTWLELRNDFFVFKRIGSVAFPQGGLIDLGFVQDFRVQVEGEESKRFFVIALQEIHFPQFVEIGFLFFLVRVHAQPFEVKVNGRGVLSFCLIYKSLPEISFREILVFFYGLLEEVQSRFVVTPHAEIVSLGIEFNGFFVFGGEDGLGG